MFRTIKSQLLLIISAVFLVAIGLVSFLIYKQSLSQIESLMSERAESIAKTTSSLLDGDAHNKIVRNLAKAGDLKEWKDLQSKLSEIRKVNEIQEDVYTLTDAYWIKPDKKNPYGQIVFTALAKSEAFQLKGQKKEKYIHEAIKNKKPGSTGLIQTINGLFVTGYAPILTSKGKVTGVVEIALSAEKEIRDARTTLMKRIAISSFFAIVLAFISIFVYANKLTSPITSLVETVRKMGKGDLSARANQKAGTKEIEILSKNFNDMAINLEKSYRELEDINLNLEEKVLERTKQLQVAKEKIATLVNSMDLGVFIFDDNYMIQDPVSRSCQEILGRDIRDHDVREMLYSCLSKDSPEWNLLNTALISVFDEDDLQWDLMVDNFPHRLVFDHDGEEQVLKVGYTPLWNDEDLLYQILIVIEDITVLEQLQRKQEKLLSENKFNNEILTAFSNMDREDIITYFETQAKKIPHWREFGVNDALAKRDIHTFKGNSAVFGMEQIAQAYHGLEHSMNSSDKTYLDELLTIESLLFKANSLANKIYQIPDYFEKSRILYFLKSYQLKLNNEFDENNQEFEASQGLMAEIQNKSDIMFTPATIDNFNKILDHSDILSAYTNITEPAPLVISVWKILHRLQSTDCEMNVEIEQSLADLGLDYGLTYYPKLLSKSFPNDSRGEITLELLKADLKNRLYSDTEFQKLTANKAINIDSMIYESPQFENTLFNTLIKFLVRTKIVNEKDRAWKLVMETLELPQIDSLNELGKITYLGDYKFENGRNGLFGRIFEISNTLGTLERKLLNEILLEFKIVMASLESRGLTGNAYTQVLKKNLDELILYTKSQNQVPERYELLSHKLLDIETHSLQSKYSKTVKSLSLAKGKKAEIKFSPQDIMINRDILYKLDEVFLHLIRNATGLVDLIC